MFLGGSALMVLVAFRFMGPMGLLGEDQNHGPALELLWLLLLLPVVFRFVLRPPPRETPARTNTSARGNTPAEREPVSPVVTAVVTLVAVVMCYVTFPASAFVVTAPGGHSYYPRSGQRGALGRPGPGRLGPVAAPRGLGPAPAPFRVAGAGRNHRRGADHCRCRSRRYGCDIAIGGAAAILGTAIALMGTSGEERKEDAEESNCLAVFSADRADAVDTYVP
ncbi:hypothetical protein FHX37_4180 [Haloactinospora alba]|uniref:Uncharacterized protein n=2 Tax=Haloactinospora alba TaxID=405555 RepID=A0A543NAH1_9ACTN|nr:hypothetical protein FHX37_4180 [Haloactinospora alba]